SKARPATRRKSSPPAPSPSRLLRSRNRRRTGFASRDAAAASRHKPRTSRSSANAARQEGDHLAAHLGSKVRTLRRREGLTQADLASKLEISASYLNLIEHNQRPLPSHLLLRVAQVLHADLGTFTDDSSARLA